MQDLAEWKQGTAPEAGHSPDPAARGCSCLEADAGAATTGTGCCFSEGSSDCLKEGINYLLKLEAGLWLGQMPERM